MAFLPQLPPTDVGASPELVAWLDRQNQDLASELAVLRSLVEELRRLRVLGGVASAWAWDDTSTAPGDPGAGFVRGNGVNLNNVSVLYVSKTDAFGRNAVLEDAWVANTPLFADSFAQNHYLYGTVTAITDFATYQTWTIGTPTGSGNPSQGDPFELRFYLPDPALVSA